MDLKRIESCITTQEAVSAEKTEQSYSEVTSLRERSIVRLHGNSFQRNLWSGTLLFGLRITATTEKWADCRNTNGFKNHSTCKLSLFPEQLIQNVHAVYSILPFCTEDYRPPEEMSISGRMSY